MVMPMGEHYDGLGPEAAQAVKPWANDMQVAGDHYAAEYQHWDFVNDTGMTYFQGNASKYVTRAFKKNGKQDLEKAVHYMNKAAELQIGPVDHIKIDVVFRFALANDLGSVQTYIMFCILYGDWPRAIEHTEKLIATL